MKVSIIGAGKAAGFIAERLRLNNLPIYQIYNRTPERGLSLATEYDAEYVDSISDLACDVDAIFFAVNDSIIDDLSESMDLQPDTLLISLSGSRDISTLPAAEQWAVMWPIYSLMPDAAQNSNIPLVVSTPQQPERVESAHVLADAISENQYILSQEKRLRAHLCAVFANNFVNFLNKEMFAIMKHNGLDTDMMTDIMESTLSYSLYQKENAKLTGPAVRRDEDTLAYHIESLAYDPVLQELYKNLSQAIVQKTKN